MYVSNPGSAFVRLLTSILRTVRLAGFRLVEAGLEVAPGIESVYFGFLPRYVIDVAYQRSSTCCKWQGTVTSK
jgi:hypothetical protein